MGIQDIRPMADEVASLMAARFGGVRRGQQADLGEMLRKRGGALPRRLRREAGFLQQADRLSGQPKLARQVDFARLEHAHRALTAYLRNMASFVALAVRERSSPQAARRLDRASLTSEPEDDGCGEGDGREQDDGHLSCRNPQPTLSLPSMISIRFWRLSFLMAFLLSIRAEGRHILYCIL